MLAFVVVFFSIPNQEIGLGKCIQNDLFAVVIDEQLMVKCYTDLRCVVAIS